MTQKIAFLVFPRFFCFEMEKQKTRVFLFVRMDMINQDLKKTKKQKTMFFWCFIILGLGFLHVFSVLLYMMQKILLFPYKMLLGRSWGG
jgi:hypothetical protein